MALPDLPSLIRAELPGHAWRLLYLRYICAAGTLFGAFILTQNMGAVLDPLPLYATAAAILLSNGLYTAHLIAAGRKTGIASSDAASRSVALQCATDVFLLTLLLHCSAGAANPLMALYVGPILITGLLLSVRATYLVATLSGLFFAGMAILEYRSIIPHVPVPGLFSPTSYRNGPYLLVVLAAFVCAIALTAVISLVASGRLRLEPAATVGEESAT